MAVSKEDHIYKKRRPDRNHIIYQLECIDTGDTYIGITAARFLDDLLRSLKYRWIQHAYKATTHGSDWPLHQAIRKYDNWTYEILFVIRGKTQAHEEERKLIKKYNPELNRQ